jgi:dihydroxyacetone kinase DhaKLM complex PTS-EIIA-like component DhaM
LQARCIISNAPLVEGAIIAAIEAGLGRTLAEINEAAEAVIRVAKVMPRA